MSTESAVVLGVAPTHEIEQLVADIEGARRRATKAEPGDRVDIERFEVLASQLELLADSLSTARLEVRIGSAHGENRYLLGGSEDWWGLGLGPDILEAARSMQARGLVPILRLYGLEPGATPEPTQAVGVPDVAERFDSKGKKGRAAVEARFRDQLSKALESAHGGTEIRPISPSGIQNPVVTEILREHVIGDPSDRVDVPVEYRDGSRSANPFPMRCLPLRADVHGQFELGLKFALLSIRHTEMDAAVDGSWLRNAEISRPRPAALTDDLVYDISIAQLEELTDSGRRTVRIEMYQTGLETAVIGFYRAVTFHLLKHPGTLAVEPMYFASGSNGNHGAPFRRGTPWTM
jgi:hypothetical protein